MGKRERGVEILASEGPRLSPLPLPPSPFHPLIQRNSLRIIYAPLPHINLFIRHRVLARGVKYIQREAKKTRADTLEGIPQPLRFNAVPSVTPFTERNFKM